jgi:chromosome segregation ATPase
MNEEPTKELRNKASFEERVFARFDAFDARFDTVDARLEKLESRAYDTKPIWERALARIMEIGLEMGEVKSKVGVIETKVGVIETKVGVIESKVVALETEVAAVRAEVAAVRTDYSGIRNELTDMKRELKHQVNKRLDLILEFLLEGRNDLRDAEERIKQLETKLA